MDQDNLQEAMHFHRVMSDTFRIVLEMLQSATDKNLFVGEFLQDMLDVRIDQCEDIGELRFAMASRFTSHIVCHLQIPLSRGAVQVIGEKLVGGDITEDMLNAVRDAMRIGVIPEEVGKEVLRAMEEYDGDGDLPQEIVDFIRTIEDHS